MKLSFWIKPAITAIIIVILLWFAGFGWFVGRTLSLKQHDINEPTGAIVVLTGGKGRIEAGLDLFAARRGLFLFITSVHPDITEATIRERWDGETQLPICCIAIDYDAETTAQNAQAALNWINSVKEASGQEITSIRLVTSNYHMMRALVDFQRFMPDMVLYPHPVISPDANIHDEIFWRLMMREYHKYLFRSAQKSLPDFLQDRVN
jgi:uncharacterized SAM-binding protein YcdF (DUF218 family)